MKQLYMDFINWVQNVGLSEVVNILSSVFIVVFLPIAKKRITSAKVDAITTVAENKTITKNYDDNQKKTSVEIKELKETIKELQANGEKTQQLLEKFGGIIALLIQNAKTSASTKDLALKLFNIPTEKVEVKEQTKTTHELVEEITKVVEEEIKSSVEKEESGQYDSLVNDLLNEYVK